MKFCIGNDLAKAWRGLNKKEDVAHAIVDIFNMGQFNKEAVRFMEEQFPNDIGERVRKLILLGIFPLKKVNWWASKLNLQRVGPAYSFKKAGEKVEMLLAQMQRNSLMGRLNS